jgi:hypothetical protein
MHEWLKAFHVIAAISATANVEPHQTDDMKRDANPAFWLFVFE